MPYLIYSQSPDAIEYQYHQLVRKRIILISIITLATLFSLFLDIILGSSSLSVSELWHALVHPFSSDTSIQVIVWEIRLPYALMALLVGMALGLAGAEMQTILNNPLASPFTLGVSSAAAFGAALAIVTGIGILVYRQHGLFQQTLLYFLFCQLYYSIACLVG